MIDNRIRLTVVKMSVFCGVSSCVGAREPLLLTWPQTEVALILRQNHSFSTLSAAAQSLLRYHRDLKKVRLLCWKGRAMQVAGTRAPQRVVLSDPACRLSTGDSSNLLTPAMSAKSLGVGTERAAVGSG
jgi:hypothetical protein